MKILIAGTEINIINVNGTNMFVQGAGRDTLEFQFSTTETDFQTLQNAFTSENCKQIKIVDGENIYLHDDYTIRTELSLKPVVIEPETPTTAAVLENRYVLKMCQMTYAEKMQEETLMKIKMHEDALVELASII